MILKRFLLNVLLINLFKEFI